MRKRLTNVIGGMLALLFVGGTILLPAFHRAHCSGRHAGHEASSCPICQFADTPAISTSPVIAPIGESMVSDNEDTPALTVPTSSWRDATRARAPPVA